MFIQTEDTPNPQSLKFLPGETISSVPMNFLNKEDASCSKLAHKLFELPYVAGVFLGYDFITITKDEKYSWEEIKAELLVTMMDFLISGDEIVNNQKVNKIKDDLPEDQIIKEIRELVETRVRPAVMQDGGDIVFRDFKDGIVWLELQGACAGCPSSTITLKNGIENMLKYYIPEIIAVEAV